MADASVCVLVVTFNRSQYLKKLLGALLEQSASIDKLVVFDNHSSDDTEALLVGMGFLPHPLEDGGNAISRVGDIEIHCIRNAENSGGSGGFHDGIEYARSLGCDYVWAMDDDVLPASDCLEKLFKQMAPDRRICIPNRTTEGFVDNVITHVDMSNPFSFNIRMRKSITPADKVTDEVTQVEDMPFEGPLIDSTLIDEIGLPNKDLFIIFDDSEYCTRALKRTTVGFVKSAHLYKQIIPRTDHSRLMGWKEYYAYRNQYWFDRTYGENAAVRVLRPFLSRCDLTLRAIVRRKWTNIRVVSRAYDDGTHGRLGKLVEPGGEV
ncbi:MAG: glycosyltransferase [Olsenella sp.]|jgi:GT2 family glycosyltransferase|nr:glycosyltransferase [Olsenella sp.]